MVKYELRIKRDGAEFDDFVSFALYDAAVERAKQWVRESGAQSVTIYRTEPHTHVDARDLEGAAELDL